MSDFYSIGFFGAPNFGDELLSKVVVDRLHSMDPGASVRVMTRSARASRDYTGLDAIFVEGWPPGPEYIANLGAHLRAVNESDLLVIGGGGLISDHYSWRGAVCYYTDACWAILLGTPHVFVGLGVVGLRRAWLRPLVRFVGRHAAAVYCRDQGSADRFTSLTGRHDTRIGPDLASLVDDGPGSGDTGDYALVNIREKPPINEAGLHDLLAVLVAEVGRVVLLPAEPGDLGYYHRILAELREDLHGQVEIAPMGTLASSTELIDRARIVVAERLHVNVVATLRNKPLLVLVYEDKVAAYMQSVGGGAASCSLDDVGAAGAHAVLALDAPDWTGAIAQLRNEAQTAFDETIAQGLAARPHGVVVRLFAILHLAWLMPLCVVFGLLISVKRMIFGRGPIRRGAGP